MIVGPPMDKQSAEVLDCTVRFTRELVSFQLDRPNGTDASQGVSRRRRVTCSGSSEPVKVARLVTPKWASMALSHEALVGVGTGWMCGRRSSAKTRG